MYRQMNKLYTVPDLRRSSRQRNPPDYFGINVNLDAVISSDEGLKDNKDYNKTKRFLGQRPCIDSTKYLV